MFIRKLVVNSIQGKKEFTGITIRLMSDNNELLEELQIPKEKVLKIANKEIYDYLNKIENEDKLIYINELKRIYEI